MVEVCISTMFLKDPVGLLNKMKIESNAIIIDQCDEEREEIINYNGFQIKIIHSKERGLSKSRNLAIKNSSLDYLIFADDDFEYTKEYAKYVENQYLINKDADIIVFGAIRNDNYVYKKFKNGKLSSKYRFNVNSIRITARRSSLIKSALLFDENFGTGSNVSCGEDTIFMTDCYKIKLNVYSSDFILCKGIKNDRESSWFHGYDKKFFVDRGLVYKRISKMHFFYSLYFLIRKHNLYKNEISFFKALKCMI